MQYAVQEVVSNAPGAAAKAAGSAAAEKASKGGTRGEVASEGFKSGAKAATGVGVQAAANAANCAALGAATNVAVGTAVKAGAGRAAVVIPQTAATGATSGALAASIGPAGWVATGSNIVGSYAGEAIGKAVGGKDGAAVGKEVGGAGAAIGGGAACGAMVGGPIGAAAGAGIGTAVYGLGKVTDYVVDSIPGQEGHVTIINNSKQTITVYSYDYGDIHQCLGSRASLELAPGASGQLAGSQGVLAMGAKCERFYVHIYNRQGTCKTSDYGRGYGILVHAKKTYSCDGSNLRQA